MFRQAIFNKKGMELIEKQYGGIGNGLVLFKDGKIKEFNKGLNKPTVSEIAKALLEED